MNIFLKCPDCNRELGISSAEGLEDKSAECPKCHNKHLIRELLPKLSLRTGEKAYQLRFGRQWIGRHTQHDGADIQISDESKYMSRKHAVMEVRCTNTGMECTYEEHGKNPSSIKGVELVADDVIYLNVNDYLQMGSIKLYLTNEYGE